MNKPTRFYSKNQENNVAKAVQGRRTANSGATAFSKGDVVTNKILIECKTTIEDKKSFTIKKEWLDKNKQEAFAMNKPYSTLVFNFGPTSDNYYVIDEKLFLRLKEVLEDEEC